MITPDYVRTMAGYNAEMNRRIYAASDRLDEAARQLDRGAFWRSIHGTLSHLAWADQMWMSRFDGWEKPGVPLAESDGFARDYPTLQAMRPEMDARLERWASSVSASWLAEDLVWFSGAAKAEKRQQRAVLLMHLFNHQTHHRGQVHAMLTAAGQRTDDTDLMLMV